VESSKAAKARAWERLRITLLITGVQLDRT
jgi:hypothetical protein